MREKNNYLQKTNALKKTKIFKNLLTFLKNSNRTKKRKEKNILEITEGTKPYNPIKLNHLKYPRGTKIRT